MIIRTKKSRLSYYGSPTELPYRTTINVPYVHNGCHNVTALHMDAFNAFLQIPCKI
ncbi:MAG: hypothetical protein J6W37_02735 [Bacteroidales bacterium]|nr:hypothetical protein [Bacteroidales bacterium]